MPLRVQSLRLKRYLHHHQHKPSRSPTSLISSSLYSRNDNCRRVRRSRYLNGNTSSHYASIHSPPSSSFASTSSPSPTSLSPTSWAAFSLVQSYLNLPSHPQHDHTPVNHATPPHDEVQVPLNLEDLEPVVRDAVLAMRAGDTPLLIQHLATIQEQNSYGLLDLVEVLPRTTVIELFRALDPVRVAQSYDPTGSAYVSVGMRKMLNMESIIDDYGARAMYLPLLMCLLALKDGLKQTGQELHMDEFISTLRCAANSSFVGGLKLIWGDLVKEQARPNGEVYLEFIKGRFFTEPQYNGFSKFHRVVTPRNLHRSSILLRPRRVRRLDVLRLMTRRQAFKFGLNREADHAEDKMRLVRGKLSILRLFQAVIKYGYRIDEEILCALMVGLGRSGALRLIGTNILQRYFGINLPSINRRKKGEKGTWNTKRNDEITSTRADILPTVRLMRAAVETYGSNGEIGIAVMMVEYLSSTWNIPIPPDVWEDLMEWTHLMCSKPLSTQWKIAGGYKIPSNKAVKMIWDAMTSPPYNHVPTFLNYNHLIRNMVAMRRYDLTETLSRMREAVALYHEQCREYEAAVFDFTQHDRDGIASSRTTQRLKAAKFKKEHMWYNISEWCRSLLKRLRYHCEDPVPRPEIPHFIREFGHFLINPIMYPQSTGIVSLRDPEFEKMQVVTTGHIQVDYKQKSKRSEGMRTWTRLQMVQRKIAFVSSHSLNHLPWPRVARVRTRELVDPLTLLLLEQRKRKWRSSLL